MTSLKVPATMTNLDLMIKYILDRIEEMALKDKKVINKLRLVCEESLVNIINYAYQGLNEIGYIEIICSFLAKDNKIIIKFIDQGIAFNLLDHEDPDITLSLEDREVGGLGIYLIKTIMDQVDYKRKDGKNILTLTKSIN